MFCCVCVFFFKQKTAYEWRISDWSSDVCSSDLFPCVPKMARRILGWPWDRPATVFGGLTFGGGPIANYMSHAIVSMVEKLRREGRYGFLFANGGFATDNHCIVLGNQPIATASFPQDFDYQAEAEAKRGPVPELVEDYAGPATI